MTAPEVNMSDLVTQHNELARQLGREEQLTFKSLEAAQAAILKLQTLLGQGATMTAEEGQAPNGSDIPPDAPASEDTNTLPVDGAAPVPEVDQAAIDAAMAAALAASQKGAGGTSPMNSVGRRGPTQGVGEFCKTLILQGKTNPEILAAVAVKFAGTAKTSNSCIAFYRNALKGGAASRPRSGKIDIAAMEAKAKELAKKIEDAKVAKAAKEAAEKLAAEQAAAQLAAMQAAQAQAAQQAAAAAAAAAASGQPAA